jgi:hypothetical protein
MKLRCLYLLSAIALISCDSDNEPDPVIEGTKLKSITVNISNNSGGFSAGSKTVYDYSSSGRVDTEKYYYFDSMTKDYVLSSTASFSYTDGVLSKISEVNEESGHVSTTTYTYMDGKPSRIDIDDGIDTEITISYNGDTIQALYEHSNGRFFTYRFSTTGNNIGFEKTIDDSNVVSSKLSNEFDDGLNPYALLNFFDPLFTNFSRNNKTKTTSQYFTHQPQSVASSYEYEYNDQNLPVKQITTYVSYPNGTFVGKAETIFEYED